MSVQAMTRVMETSETKGVTRLVMLVIANHETEDRGAFPSIDRLAHETGTGIRTVQEAIRRAVKAGELEVAYRRGPHGTNVYRTVCGLSGRATLAGTEPTDIHTPQNPHPADIRRVSAPERKERVTGSGVASASSSTDGARPSDELWEKLVEIFGTAPTDRRFRGKWNVAAAELRTNGVTPEEIGELVAWARRDRDQAWRVATPAQLAAQLGQLRKLASTRELRVGYDDIDYRGALR